MWSGIGDVKEEWARVISAFFHHLDGIVADQVGEIKRFVVCDVPVIVDQARVEKVVSSTAFEAENSLETSLNLWRCVIISGSRPAVPFT